MLPAHCDIISTVQCDLHIVKPSSQCVTDVIYCRKNIMQIFGCTIQKKADY